MVSNRCLVWEVRDFDWHVGSWENPERLVIFGQGNLPPQMPETFGLAKWMFQSFKGDFCC